MGIILKSLVAGKPIVVMPRKLELNEHTTDHQMATAVALDKMKYVQIAWDNEELRQFLQNPGQIRSRTTIGNYASDALIGTLKTYIQEH
jgi:UDP-N-acetylglucosamine transferase subunit ALG13